jgi:tetratricopeptide (TPR) repeat protein
MRRLIFVFLMCSVGAWAQGSNPPKPALPDPTAPIPGTESSAKPAKPSAPDLSPPRSDRVNASDLSDDGGESSSKDTKIDLSPPENDVKTHPQSKDALEDAETTPGASGVGEFHPWDPHRAAKNVEVGDFYFKRKNYHAAEDRYREALAYKDNDALATFRLAVCLEKLERPVEAQREYEKYLEILPRGGFAPEAQKAIDKLKGPAASAKSVK